MKNYPRMLFPAGDASAEPMIVDDPGQEAAARADGYRIAGEAAESEAAPKPAKKKAK